MGAEREGARRWTIRQMLTQPHMVRYEGPLVQGEVEVVEAFPSPASPEGLTAEEAAWALKWLPSGTMANKRTRELDESTRTKLRAIAALPDAREEDDDVGC